MPRLGRYKDRYEKSEFLVESSRQHQAGNIGPDSHLTDIACADFDNFKVQCWPGTESCPVPRRRRWGKFNGNHAVIIPFRLRAGQSSTYRVKTVEMKLLFSSTITKSASVSAASQNTACSVMEHPPEVCLIDLPAPIMVQGSNSAVKQKHEPWTFRSEPITDRSGGTAPGAVWTWNANHHDPGVLHGAVAVQHPGDRFLVECSVSGRASQAVGHGRNGRKLRRRFRYDSDSRPWCFIPQAPEADLPRFEQAIRELDIRVRLLNTDGAMSSGECKQDGGSDLC